MVWNEIHICFLRENYPLFSRVELCNKFNMHFGLSVSKSQLISTLKRNNITSGRNGRFKKGCRPWHAGTSGKKGRTSGTFKKGASFKTHKKIGDELNRNGIIFIKTENGSVRPKHHILWENYNKKIIPFGHRVIFIDGDKRNFSKNNLIAVNRSQLASIIKKGLSLKQDDLSKSEKLLSIICFHNKMKN